MPEPTVNPQKIAIPLCQYCEAELPALGVFSWSVGLVLITCIFCPECKKSLHFTAMPMPQEGSRLVT